jgi:RNA polymerase sigma-70 factor (ECF subfamily)
MSVDRLAQTTLAHGGIQSPAEVTMSVRRAHRHKTMGDEIRSVQSAVDLVLRRLIGTQDPEYEDLVQSSMENVLATIERGNFRGDCPTGGWAAVIARNVAVDAIRVRTRERQLFAHDQVDLAHADADRHGSAARGPEHLTDVQERLRRVESALVGLHPHKANVVVLHDVLGHPLEEIAGILDISVAAAQSRLVRGRRQIIDRVGDRTPGPTGRRFAREPRPSASTPGRKRPGAERPLC